MGMALAIVVALTAQFVIGTDNDAFRAANFFSYFTVLSNVVAVVALVGMAIRAKPAAGRGLATLRGAATLYMTVTGLVYVTVLLPLETDVGVSEPWIDWVIHGIGPIFMLVDWLLNPPPERLKFSRLWVWLIFPAAYLAYTLFRGPRADWYPYPFLDPSAPGSYTEVAIGSLIVLAAIIAVGLALIWWTRRRVPARSEAPPRHEKA